MKLNIDEYKLYINQGKTVVKQNTKTVKSTLYFAEQISHEQQAKVNFGMAKSYFGITSFKGTQNNSESDKPYTYEELSNIKLSSGKERFNTEEKTRLVDLSKKEPKIVRKLTGLEKNGKPLLQEHHIEILIKPYKEHPEAVDELLSMEDSKQRQRWGAFDIRYILKTYLAHPKGVKELSKIEESGGYPKFGCADVDSFAEDYEVNPDFLKKYNLFETLNYPIQKWTNEDIKYAIKLSQNPEMENFIIDNFDNINCISSKSSDNFFDIEMGRKKIHIQANNENNFRIIGIEEKKQKDNIVKTELKRIDGSVKKEEYSKKGTQKNQGYIETIHDKDGNIVSRTLTKPSKRNPGVLVILREVLDKNGNLVKIQELGTVKNFGKHKTRRRIEKNFTSPLGVNSRQLILEVQNGSRLEYKIENKTFNRVSRKIDVNTTETYVWGKKYTTKYNKDNIEVSVEKKNGRIEKYVLNDKQLDFFMLPVYKQIPDDYLYIMAKFGTKTDITDLEIWKNNAYYDSNENKIEMSFERANDPFTFTHELGHMIDELPLKNLHSDKKLKEIFQKELDAYKSQATGLNEEEIMYFISKEHQNSHGCLAEVIAETVAILSGLNHNEDHLLLRAKLLQENFPETISYIGSQIQKIME